MRQNGDIELEITEF